MNDRDPIEERSSSVSQEIGIDITNDESQSLGRSRSLQNPKTS